MTEIIFYSYISPETPSDSLTVRLGRLKRSEWDRKTMTYRGFKSWMSKCSHIFIPIHDKTLSFQEVVYQYNQCQKFAKLVNMPDLATKPMNDVMISELSRGSLTHLRPLSTQIESAIEAAYHGGVHYAMKDYVGMGYKYDITSCYPSIACSKKLFPMGQPTFQCIDNIVDFETPALYLVTCTKSVKSIERPQDSFIVYSEQPKWYTNVDIVTALALDCNIELELETENCLTFQDTLEGKEIFGDYVSKIFHVKQTSECPEMKTLAKHFLNKICGLLAKKERHYFGTDASYPMSRGQKEILDGKVVLEEALFDNEGNLVGMKTRKKSQIFSYPSLCHLPAFITAYTRNHLCNLFLEHDSFPHVKQINTDGWILDQPVKYNTDSKSLGGIKLEAKGQCHIHHVRKVEWGGMLPP
jgi:hypothetical protein